MQRNGIRRSTLQRICKMYGTPVHCYTACLTPNHSNQLEDCYWFAQFQVFAGLDYDMPECLTPGKYHTPRPRPSIR